MSIYRKDKLMKLFQTKDWSDCTFLINEDKIPAHKFLLACTSPVFESMFYGDMSSNEVIIEDIEASVFKKALEYVYTDKVGFESVAEAWGLVYVSQKYFLSDLQGLCVEYIQNNLSINNLLMSYEYSKLYNEKLLTEKCLKDISTFGRGLLLYNNYHVQPKTMQAIVKANRENMVDTFLLAVSWGMVECTLQDIEQSKENVSSIFDKYGILSDVCFKTFGFFFNYGMLMPLTKDQIYVLENIIDLARQFDMAIVRKSQALFYRPKIDHFHFRTEYKSSMLLHIRRSELISPTLSCNRDCLIFGLAVTTMSTPINSRNDGGYVGGANIYIYQKQKNNLSRLIYEHAKQQTYYPYDNVQEVSFPVPILFEASKQYMVCVEYVSDQYIQHSVPLKFMSDTLAKNKSNPTVIQFSDEGNGTVIKGVCFYEA